MAAMGYSGSILRKCICIYYMYITLLYIEKVRLIKFGAIRILNYYYFYIYNSKN